MTKFRECVIHIGTTKTATTTLQSFFQKNKLNFTKNDILIPTTLGEPNQTKLSAYAADIQKINDLRKNRGLTNEKLINNFRERVEKSFREEVKNQNFSKLLISSEHLHSKLTGVEEVQLVKKFLDEFVETYKIIVYIRPQHEMAVSNFSTLCKTGGTKKIVLPKIQEKSTYYNLETLLNRWAEVFGFDNIIVRIFSRKEFHEEDIKKDFVKILGLDWNNFEDVENSNESINSNAQRFLLELNKFLPLWIDNKKNNLRGNLDVLVSQNREGQGLMPTSDQAEDFFRIFSNSNEKVREKWFPEKKELFEVDFSKYPKKTQTETDLSFAFEIFADVWSKKQKEVLNLKQILKQNEQ